MAALELVTLGGVIYKSQAVGVLAPFCSIVALVSYVIGATVVAKHRCRIVAIVFLKVQYHTVKCRIA